MRQEDDFDTTHLQGIAKIFAENVCRMIEKDNSARPYGGGCKAFYSPDEWKEIGNNVPDECILVLCYDGGDLSHYCNYNYANINKIEKFTSLLQEHGLWTESQNSVTDYVFWD